MTDHQFADKLRRIADGMTNEIENKMRPSTQNPTPKRNRELQSRMIDGRNLQRAQAAALALANAFDSGAIVPASLQAARWTKPDLLNMTRKRLSSNGYYDMQESADWSDNSPAALALRALMDASATPEDAAVRAEKERETVISQKIGQLIGCSIDGFFQTPHPVVSQMLDLAGWLDKGMTVLEPSAGTGDIAEEISERWPDAIIDCVEVVPRLADILDLKAKRYPVQWRVILGDFLEMHPDDTHQYDRIIMNPPFENGQDMAHVMHAYKFLKPGGILVAIMANSWTFRNDRKFMEFRNWLDDEAGCSADDRIELPSGTFAQPGTITKTNVATTMIRIIKDR